MYGPSSSVEIGASMASGDFPLGTTRWRCTLGQVPFDAAWWSTVAESAHETPAWMKLWHRRMGSTNNAPWFFSALVWLFSRVTGVLVVMYLLVGNQDFPLVMSSVTEVARRYVCAVLSYRSPVLFTLHLFLERFCGYSVAMLGSSVDTCSVSIPGALGRLPHVLRSGVLGSCGTSVS